MKNNWEETTLGKVIYFERGLTYPKSKEVSFSKNIVLRANNITLETNSLNFEELKYISDDFFVPQEKKVKKNSLLICIASGSKIHLGKIAIIDKNYNYAFGGFMGLIIPKDNLNTKFLYYVLNSKKYKDFISKLTDGININNLKYDDLKNFLFYLPPLQEQKRIVEKLDKAFANIDKLTEIAKQNLENTKELFNSYLNKLFTKNKGWERKKLSDICDVRDGTHDSPKYVKEGEGYPFVTSKNLKNGKIVFDKIQYISKMDYEKINQRSKVDIGDILMAMIGTIGNPVVVSKKPTFAIKNVALIKKSKHIDSYFLKYLLETKNTIKLMEKEASGSNQRFVSLNYLRNFYIQYPPLQQQKQIVKILDNLQEKTKKLEEIYNEKIELAKELKQSILHKELSNN